MKETLEVMQMVNMIGSGLLFLWGLLLLIYAARISMWCAKCYSELCGVRRTLQEINDAITRQEFSKITENAIQHGAVAAD